MKVRLQRFLASAGIASRRASESLIVAGRVLVNGTPVVQLGARIDPASDRVAVDGKPVRPARRLYVALHKPTGVVCSRKDPQGRRTVLDLLPQEWCGLYPVGRLDYDTEGLLFLTNDGELCLRLTHPRYGVLKTYHATVAGRFEAAQAALLVRGVLDHGERLRAESARVLRSNKTNSVIELELREGKNREVRRLLAGLGRDVVHLRRVRIGPIRLGELPLGKWRVLSPTEVRCLLQRSAKH